MSQNEAKMPQTDFLKAITYGDADMIAHIFNTTDDFGTLYKNVVADLENMPKGQGNIATFHIHILKTSLRFQLAQHVDEKLYHSCLHDIVMGFAAHRGHEDLYMYSAKEAPASTPGTHPYLYASLASEGGNYKIVNDVCQRHSIPVDFENNITLYSAIERGDLEMVQKLCETHAINPAKGNPINDTMKGQLGTPVANALVHAIHCNRHNIATYLLVGQSVEPLYHNGAALTAALLYKRPYMLDEMLTQHVRHIPAGSADTFLYQLAASGDVRRIQELHKGEKLDLKTHAQPLFEGAFSRGNINVIEYLTQHIDPKLSDFEPRSWQMFKTIYNASNAHKRCVIFAKICGVDVEPFKLTDIDAYKDIQQAYQKAAAEREESLQKTWHQVNRHTLQKQSHQKQITIKRRSQAHKRRK